MGLTTDDIEGLADVEVYPENWEAYNVFTAMSTQWRVGMGGATGLDYTALPAVMSLVGVKRAARPDLFQCLRVMEHEALTVFAESQKQ